MSYYSQWATTGAAVRLSTILGVQPNIIIEEVSIKNGKGSRDSVFWGGSNVTSAPANAGGEIAPGEAYTFHNEFPGDIYLVGTAGSTVFITYR